MSRTRYFSIYLFLLLLNGLIILDVDGAWRCSKSSSATAEKRSGAGVLEEKECEANFSAPTNVRRLSEAMLYNPMAEYDFHYNCLSEAEAETVDEVKMAKTAAKARKRRPGGGLERRLHDTDDKYKDLEECENAKQVLPGIKEMMYGYNIVSDKYSKETGHLQVLDVTSRAEFGATAEDPIAKGNATIGYTPVCYKVPDAFVSQGISVVFTSDSSRDFRATGATSTEEYREAKMKNSLSELSVEGSGSYGPISVTAGLSTSKTTSNFDEMGGSSNSTRDTSSIEYVEVVFEATIHTPEPSKQLLNRWRNLARMNTSTADQINHAFNVYFNEAGTHYFNSAMMGGKFSLQYVTETHAKSRDKKTAQASASCVAAKAGVSILGKFGANVEKKDCNGESSNSSRKTTATDYMADLRTHCRGGNAGLCPSSVGNESHQDFKDWRSTLRILPAPIHGTKRWITWLIDHILQSYGGTGFESKIYERIILEFGNVNDNVEQAAKRLKEFRDKLDKQLIRYLGNAAADHILKFNGTGKGGNKTTGGIGAWNLAEGFELIDPKSHLGWHSSSVDWSTIDLCPGGEFAKAASIDIQVTPYDDPNDWTGLQKANLFCTNGKRISGDYIHHGQTSKQVTCPGYLIGYRMRGHQIQGINSGDDRGATNLEYKCMVEGSGEVRTLKMVVECKRDGWDAEQVKRCEDEQKIGDWGEWRMCPDKSGIMGIKTKLMPFAGEGVDDAGILDVGYWCLPLPANGLTSPPPNTTAIPCARKTDLVIALDTSTSILPTDFEIGCDFAARLAGAFHPPSRVSFVVFSDLATVAIPIDSGLTPEEIYTKIAKWTRVMGGTHTELAINEAMAQLHNPRPGTPRKLVVITDGISNVPAATAASAEAAKKAGIILFSVGIGSQTGTEELMLLAGGDKDRRFSVNDFDKLLQIIAPVSVEVCDSN